MAPVRSSAIESYAFLDEEYVAARFELYHERGDGKNRREDDEGYARRDDVEGSLESHGGGEPLREVIVYAVGHKGNVVDRRLEIPLKDRTGASRIDRALLVSAAILSCWIETVLHIVISRAALDQTYRRKA